MKHLYIGFLALIPLVAGLVYAVPDEVRTFWGMQSTLNIDDQTGTAAKGTIYSEGQYGNNCTFDRATNTRSAGCGLNPSGKRDAMQFNYDAGGGMINQVGFFSDGRISIDSIAPSDGSDWGGQELEFDIEGAVGAQHYCDASGTNCYTPQELRSGIPLIDSNANWPTTPTHKDRVFNRDGRTVQIFDAASQGGPDQWQPTYTKFMEYNATQIGALSPAPEIGDQVTSQECDVVLTYNGTTWIDLTNTEINLTTCAIVP